MTLRRARFGNPKHSSLTLVLALLSLLLGSFDVHTEHALETEQHSGSQEVFASAAHPLAPLHLEAAGTASHRHSCLACLHLLRSTGTDAQPVSMVPPLDQAGASPVADTPRLAPGARSPLSSRGPPAPLA